MNRLIFEKVGEKRAIDLQAPVVGNEALPFEFSHKLTDSRARGTDHLRQGRLADLHVAMWLQILDDLR